MEVARISTNRPQCSINLIELILFRGQVSPVINLDENDWSVTRIKQLQTIFLDGNETIQILKLNQTSVLGATKILKTFPGMKRTRRYGLRRQRSQK